MAHAATIPADIPDDQLSLARPTVQAPPLAPGKVAMWIFLATEIMFFTGLIGTYIVLRAGSPPTAYSNLFPPATDLSILPNNARPEELRTYAWPRPYDPATNPLSVGLTTINTFILLGSSFFMSLALGAIQRGHRWRANAALGLTTALGATFVGIQVYEYAELLFDHRYPIGVSPTGHFTPDVSLFASCFFTMTGFHGAHVAVGVVLVGWLALRSALGSFSPRNYAAVECIGLYWHFVDLVWVVLFTVVYLI